MDTYNAAEFIQVLIHKPSYDVLHIRPYIKFKRWECESSPGIANRNQWLPLNQHISRNKLQHGPRGIPEVYLVKGNLTYEDALEEVKILCGLTQNDAYYQREEQDGRLIAYQIGYICGQYNMDRRSEKRYDLFITSLGSLYPPISDDKLGLDVTTEQLFDGATALGLQDEVWEEKSNKLIMMKSGSETGQMRMRTFPDQIKTNAMSRRVLCLPRGVILWTQRSRLRNMWTHNTFVRIRLSGLIICHRSSELSQGVNAVDGNQDGTLL